MKISRFAIGIYLALVFCSGALVGAFGYRLYTAPKTQRDPAEFRRWLVNEYQRRLKLNQEQVRQVNGILDEMRARYREEHERTKQEIKTEQHERINAILDDNQKAEYEKMRQERRRRQQERARSSPPKGN